MKIIEIHGQTATSTIAIGESLGNLTKYVKNAKTIIITDQNLDKLYKNQFPQWDTVTIGMGEKIKTLETMEVIYQKLVEMEIDRSCLIIGIGGGIVCDITGFAASTYMRGLDFGFVSTSLLSQVDASVGGKNGVNFHGYKNMIGTFNQPDFVICDTTMLKTLPHNELLCGFAEIVKHAAIGSKEMFAFLENNYQKALDMDTEILEDLVCDSVKIKAAVVRKDEKEKGERRKLNFGHTLGHAIEKTMGLLHGEAVSLGMVFAANLSVKRGLLPQKEAERICSLLERIGLPVRIDLDKEKIIGAAPPTQNLHHHSLKQSLPKYSSQKNRNFTDSIIEALKKDKKREGGGIHFVLLRGMGEAVIEEIPIGELEVAVHDLC